MGKNRFIPDMFEQCREYSLLRLHIASDRTLLRCTVRTYNRGTDTEDALDIIFRDMKKRHAKTLKAAGVTAAQLLDGTDEDTGLKMISEYFIDHDGPVTGYDAPAALGRLNRKIMEYRYKTVSCRRADLSEIARDCGLRASGDEQALLEECLKHYRKMHQLEQNPFGCAVNYAYCLTLEYEKKPREVIYCDTTLGRISYDTETDLWAMSRKERNRTGYRIENFDLDDVKRQLRNRYQVHNMSELLQKLRKKAA